VVCECQMFSHEGNYVRQLRNLRFTRMVYVRKLRCVILPRAPGRDQFAQEQPGIVHVCNAHDS